MDEYLKQAKTFLKDTKTRMFIEPDGTVDGFPNSDDKLPHNKYKITMKRNGRSYVFPFYGSYFGYKNNIVPTVYDVLACLECYEPEKNMWDFAKEYGYTIDSEETYNRCKNTWSECHKQYNELLKLYDFDTELMEKLAEIR